MSDAPFLTDRAALARNRARARSDALFLHRLAVDEVQDRLELVNRTFTSPAIVTPFPQVWAGVLPGARIVPDDDVLSLEVGAHDLTVHAMALHWANDPVGQIIQCRRALRPDGLFLGLSLGGQTLAALRSVLAESESAETDGLSPRVAPMAELREMGGLMQRAGLALPVADIVTQRAEYRDLWHLMRDLRAMGEGNALTARLRRPTRRGVFERANRLYKGHFATPEGRLPAIFEILCLTGWAPDASQPKPLRPGSAAARLADALGADETPLPD